MGLIERVRSARDLRASIESSLTEKQLAEIRQVAREFIIPGKRSIRCVADSIIEEYQLLRKPTSVREMVSRIVKDELEKKNSRKDRTGVAAKNATRKTSRRTNQAP